MKYVQIYLNNEKEYCIIPAFMLVYSIINDYDVIELYNSEEDIWENLNQVDKNIKNDILDFIFDSFEESFRID